MSVLHPQAVDRALSLWNTEENQVLADMEARASREDFPTVGPEVGAFLQWFVAAGDVTRVFECGSGFGYSAYWMAQALPRGGLIVLTDLEAANLEDAQGYLDEADVSVEIEYADGDALDHLGSREETFDLILLDHENERYREGFEIAKDALSPRGTIIADNVLHSWEYNPEEIAEGLAGAGEPAENSSLAGMQSFLQYVRSQASFQTCLLPIGEGLCLATKTRKS